MSEVEHNFQRVNEITNAAKSVWLAMLAAQIYSLVSFASFIDAEYFRHDGAMKLPIVSIDVEVWAFFLATPVLLVATFTYLHVYLIKLFKAIGKCPPYHGGRSLSDIASPWLITDMALLVRKKLRPTEADCIDQNPLNFTLSTIVFLSVWVFTPLIILYGWYKISASHSALIYAVFSLSLVTLMIVGLVSIVFLLNVSAERKARGRPATILISGVYILATVLAATYFAMINFGSENYLRRADLSQAALSERPSTWKPYHEAFGKFWSDWCSNNVVSEREALECSQFQTGGPFRMWEAWALSRRLEMACISATELTSGLGLRAGNFRFADLDGAFFASSDFSGIDFTGATMAYAIGERANFSGANLSDIWAFQVQFQDAVLENIIARGGTFAFADLDGATLTRAKLDNSLQSTSLQGAVLSLSLIGVQSDQDFEGVFDVETTDFRRSVNVGGALRHVDLGSALFDEFVGWQTVFLDGSVTIPFDLYEWMGKPCQWADEELSDVDFFGRWRWWVEHDTTHVPFSWASIAPIEWRDVEVNPGPIDCVWPNYG